MNKLSPDFESLHNILTWPNTASQVKRMSIKGVSVAASRYSVNKSRDAA